MKGYFAVSIFVLALVNLIVSCSDDPNQMKWKTAQEATSLGDEREDQIKAFRSQTIKKYTNLNPIVTVSRRR